MDKTKIIAMYLPQYHRIKENDEWWGEGFTDWIATKEAFPLFNGHEQPKAPQNNNYYNLSEVESIRWQANLARENGIYGFGIYHYWFSADMQLLQKPAELLLRNRDININFFFSWDNCSWIRSWAKRMKNSFSWSSKYDGRTNNIEHCRDAKDSNSILAELVYGGEEEWTKHFAYLLDFFKDERYIKIENKPLFMFFANNDIETMKKMIRHWNILAKTHGFSGMYMMSRKFPFHSMNCFDSYFTYEPMYSAWQNNGLLGKLRSRAYKLMGKEQGLKIFEYDEVWEKIIRNAERCKDEKEMFGGFVHYDDTPRHAEKGRIVLGETPGKFKEYMTKLLKISEMKNKKFVFLTAWNEWGEGAYLEPDVKNGNAYLEAVKNAVDTVGIARGASMR